MPCCSQRRHVLPATPQLRGAVTASLTTPQLAPSSALVAISSSQRLLYLGDSPLSLRGPFSARIYEVDALLRLIEVDVRDVAPLLRTALFEREA
jgi:hypothetical protein